MAEKAFQLHPTGSEKSRWVSVGANSVLGSRALISPLRDLLIIQASGLLEHAAENPAVFVRVVLKSGNLR
jgi:hypothetical protein